MRTGRVRGWLVPDTTADGRPSLNPVLGPWALRRAAWNIVLGVGLVVVAPIAALVSGEILALFVLGGLGVLVLGLGLAGRWAISERRGLAAPPGSRESRVTRAVVAGVGAVGFVVLAGHGIAGGGADEVAVGVGGALLLGGLALVFALRR